MMWRCDAPILIAAARGPMTSGRVARFYEGTQDERMDHEMCGCRIAISSGLGLCRTAATIQSDNGSIL